MKNRPLLWIALAFLAGTLAGAAGYLDGFAPPFLVAFAGIILSFALRRYAALGLCVAVFAAAALHWNARHLGPPGDPLSRLAANLPESLRFEIDARVRKSDILLAGDDYTQLLVDAQHVRVPGRNINRVIHGGVLIRWTNPNRPYAPGDRIRLTAPIEVDLSRINPGTPSYEDYLRRHGIHSAMRARGPGEIETLSRGSLWNPLTAADRFRNHLAERLTRAVPNHAIPFLLTVWLGDRRRIDNAEYESYLNSGAAHILAVSGVHTGIVYVSVAVALRLALGQRRKRIQAVAVMGAVFAFALMAGARVPSVRAATMIALYLAAELFDREPDAPTALSVACIGFLAVNPDILFDTGFQLSFLSIASILLFAGPFEQRLERIPWSLRRGLSTSLAVQILPLPAALTLFGVFPFVAPLVNLAVIPLLGVTLWLAFLASALALVFLPAARLFGHALAIPASAIEVIAQSIANMDALRLEVTAPTTAATLSFALAVVCLYLFVQSESRRRWSAGGLIAALIVTVATWSPLNQPAQIVFLDVGHSDATFVRSQNGETMLVDAGDRNELLDCGRRYVAPFLRAHHVKRIDRLVITHDDRDHVGGVPYILAHFDVGAVYVGPESALLEEPNDVSLYCERYGVPMKTIALGDSLDLGRAKVDVLHPAKTYTGSDNNRSVVLRVTWPGMRVLLTGDIEWEAERELADMDCDVNVLKVPHHGSLTSSSRLLIVATRPTHAVISTGRRRGGKVVRNEIIERYTEQGIQVYRTDFDGGVRIRSERAQIKVETARTLRGYVKR